MKKQLLLLLPILAMLVWSCGGANQAGNTEQTQDSTATEKQATVEANPAAEGFNVQNSDKKAIDIADEVMKAMGGRKAWDETRLVTWNFFGRRQLYWDKQTGDVRIDYNNGKFNVLLNVYNKEGEALKGKVMKDSVEVTQPDSLQKYLKRGKSIWINDMYWLFMPFKLKDSGVTLKYAREDTVQNGKKADVLTLTFQEVGDTPENKYEVYVNQETKLVEKWAYFPKAAMDTARITTPWVNYEKYGNLMLSGDRGKYKLSAIQVADQVPEKLFTTFEKIEIK